MSASKVVSPGDVFSRLTVRDLTGNTARCVCSCGSEVLVKVYKLLNGNNKSCGCLKTCGDSHRTHGQSNSRLHGYKSRTYGIWQALKDRCLNPNNARWHQYGGRGISVCELWRDSYEAFVFDMGEAPVGCSIDRIDVNGAYCKTNCRWATAIEQSRNKRNSVCYMIDNEVRTVNDWAKHWGVWWNQAKKRLDSMEGATRV